MQRLPLVPAIARRVRLVVRVWPAVSTSALVQAHKLSRISRSFTLNHRSVFPALILAFSGIANAQPAQQPDPAFMNKALQVLQQQRNNAQDQLAAEQARRLMVEEDNTKLKADLDAAKKPADKPKE
jgi:hypothetical protein